MEGQACFSYPVVCLTRRKMGSAPACSRASGGLAGWEGPSISLLSRRAWGPSSARAVLSCPLS